MAKWLFLFLLSAAASAGAQTSLQWVNSISSNGADQAFAVDTDSGDAVVSGGKFFGTVDFDPGPDVSELTAAGEEPFLVKYTGAGDLVWAKHLSGSGQVTDIAVDSNDDILVAGEFSGSLVVDPMLTLMAVASRDIFVARVELDEKDVSIADAVQRQRRVNFQRPIKISRHHNVPLAVHGYLRNLAAARQVFGPDQVTLHVIFDQVGIVGHDWRQLCDAGSRIEIRSGRKIAPHIGIVTGVNRYPEGSISEAETAEAVGPFHRRLGTKLPTHAQHR